MFYIGTSGWSYDGWVENFYPRNIPKNKWLGYYAESFDTVEVNASFYRLPSKNMINGWINSTPDNFKLTFKGSKLITHNKKLVDVEEYLQRFYNRILLAEKKLGVVLWQLPPQLKKDIDRLEIFLNFIDKKCKNCIEFRHKSWFDNEIYELLQSYDTAFCIISAPKFPENIQITTDFAYIRWHGKYEWYKDCYSIEELKKWAKILKELDVAEVYGYFNNDDNAFAIENGKELLNLLEM
jgi:uncharacterized protein YecE (DUF72 family)